MTIELKNPFSHQLGARYHSRVLEASWTQCLHVSNGGSHSLPASNLSAFPFCNQLPHPPTSTLKAFKWLMFSGQAHLDNFPIISSTVPYNIPRNKSKISCAQSQKSGKAYIPGIGNLGSHIRILPTVVRLFRREQK